MAIRARSLLTRSSQLVRAARRLRSGIPGKLVKGLLLLAAIGFVLGAAWLIWWARSPYRIKIAIGPSSATAQLILDRWTDATNRQSARLRVSLVPAHSHQDALSQLRRGDAHVALVRIEPNMPGDVRSIGPVHRRYLVRGTRVRQDPDSELVDQLLASVLGSQQPIPSYRLIAGEQLPSTSAAPRDVLCRSFLDDRSANSQDAAALGLGADGADENGKELAWRDNCLSIQFHLVAMGRLDKYLVLEIARELFERTRSLRGEISAMRFVRLALSYDANEVLRAHDGVALFLDRENQTFIERHSDLIYLLVAAMSVIATALAAAYAILHQRLLDSGKRYLVRLIVLIDQTTRAENVRELDRIEAAFDKNKQGFALEIVNRSVHDRTIKSFELLASALVQRLDAERRRFAAQP